MESWMPFFVVVTALAVVLQAVMLIALFVQMRRTAKRVEQTVADLNTKLNPLITRVQILVEDISPRITGIVADASEITRLARSEAQKVDRILSDADAKLPKEAEAFKKSAIKKAPRKSAAKKATKKKSSATKRRPSLSMRELDA